jgi:hypothetical protein
VVARGGVLSYWNSKIVKIGEERIFVQKKYLNKKKIFAFKVHDKE